MVPSVKAAVERFHPGVDEADFTVMLPTTTPPRTSKGKGRDYGDVGLLDDEGSQSLASRAKGKGRASDVSLDSNDGDTSGHIRVRGKERELVAAKEEHRRNERRWEKDKDVLLDDQTQREKARDKERIRMLEEEVSRLKEEVSILIHSASISIQLEPFRPVVPEP